MLKKVTCSLARTAMKQSKPIRTHLTGAQVKGKLVKYDFTNMAWVIDGKYKCIHPPHVDCGCYGREHEGQKPRRGARIV